VISHTKVHSVCVLYRPGEWLWVDSNSTDGKPTFRRPANQSWLSKICNHFADIVVGSRWRHSCKSWPFWDKRLLTGKFSKMFSKKIHHLSGPRRVQISWNMAYRKSV